MPVDDSAYDFHPEAKLDLIEIIDFIAHADPAAAERVLTAVLDRLKLLTRFPHQGHRRVDLTSKPLRFVYVRSYLIAYAPEDKPLWIVAIMHGHRSPRTMAAILRGREQRRIS